jgi:hypothetical protein
LVDDLRPIRLAAAVLLVMLACFTAVTAVLMTYVAVTGRTEAPTRWRPRSQKGRKGS